MKLGTRLAAAAGLLVVVLVAAGVFLPRTVRASQVAQVDQQLRVSLPVALGLSSQLDPRRTIRFTSAVPLTPLSNVYVAKIVGNQRDVLARPQVPNQGEPKAPAQTTQGQFGTASPETVGSLVGDGSWRAVMLTTRNGDRVLVAVSLDPVVATARRMTIALLIAGAGVLLAIAAGGWWLVRLGLRPISEVTEVADAISSGDRSRRVRSGKSGTEAAHLAKAFNVMLDEQQTTEVRLRQFIADASHELRTPVTAIGGFTDLFRQGALEPEQISEMMRRIGQESARMRDLVEDLLLLARLDESWPADRSPINLAVLAGDALIDASATHPSRELKLEVPHPVLVSGDDGQLRQVISNLVTNALLHAESKAPITLKVEQRGDVAVLTVSDLGAGMSPEQANHAFDRFWRADPGRSRHGSGLGLSIVKGIVEAHNGQVSLVTVPGQGTTVEVKLPVHSGSVPVAGTDSDLPSPTGNQ